VPSAFAVAFGAVALAFLVARRRSFEQIPSVPPTIVLAAALILQPIAYPVFGFVVAATLLFAATATAIRGGASIRRIATDAAIGLALSATLYLVFTRLLSVNL
jgi:hypothetical protein